MVEATQISDVKIVEPRVFADNRGFFFEAFNTLSLKKEGIDFTPIQENCAFSMKKGTIRGLHFQNDPMAQAKLVRCTVGRVMDYAIDLRKNSPTYLKYVAVELSAENKRQLYIPRGFAHGVISEYCLFKWKGAEFDTIENSGDRVGGFTVQADTMEELCAKHERAVNELKVLDVDGNDMMRRDLLTAM